MAVVSPFNYRQSASPYSDTVGFLVKWYNNHGSLLNASKTKELMLNFMQMKDAGNPVAIDGDPVKQVSSLNTLF